MLGVVLEFLSKQWITFFRAEDLGNTSLHSSILSFVHWVVKPCFLIVCIYSLFHRTRMGQTSSIALLSLPQPVGKVRLVKGLIPLKVESWHFLLCGWRWKWMNDTQYKQPFLFKRRLVAPTCTDILQELSSLDDVHVSRSTCKWILRHFLGAMCIYNKS